MYNSIVSMCQGYIHVHACGHVAMPIYGVNRMAILMTFV